MQSTAHAPHPLISAVLISWNRLDYLQKAIDSLLEQNYPNLEFIVIDNGSTDDSLPWLRSQSHIHLIENRKNIGASAARNQGIHAAKGEYVLFMDSDAELLTPRALESLVNQLESTPKAAGSAGLIYSDDECQTLWCCSPSMDWEGNHDPVASLQIQTQPPILSTCFSLFRRSALIEIGGFDEYLFYLYEDGDLCERLGKRGYIFLLDPEVKIVHHYAEPGRTRRGKIAFHYYHERLRTYYVLKNWGIRAFMRSWLSKLLYPLDFKKKFPYLPIMCYIDIYVVRSTLLILAFPYIKVRRKKRWV